MRPYNHPKIKTIRPHLNPSFPNDYPFNQYINYEGELQYGEDICFLTLYVYKTGYVLKDYVHNQEASDIHNIFWILSFER